MAALDNTGTYAHWLFNGNGNDSSGNARPINMSSGPFVSGLNDQAWNCAGAQYAYCVASGVGAAVGLASSLTIDIVFFPTNVQFPGQAVADAHMFAVRPTNPDVNWWLIFGLDQTTRNWWWAHTYNTGTPIWVERNTGAKPLWGYWNIVTYRRKPDPGHLGKLIVSVFHNGVKIDEVDNITPPDGSNPNGTALWFNYNASLQGGEFGGLYDEIRIKQTAEADATILAYHTTVGVSNPPYGISTALQTIVADASGLTLTFDQSVSGAGITPSGTGSGWNPNGATIAPGLTQIVIPITDVPPMLLSVNGTPPVPFFGMGRVKFNFDLPVNFNNPTVVNGVNTGWSFVNPGWENGSPTAATTIYALITDVPPPAPTLQSVVGDALGLTLTFNADVSLGTPALTLPTNRGWTFTTITQPSSTSLRADVGDVPPDITRISATQFPGRVRLTFSTQVAATAPVLESGGTGWDLSGYATPSSVTFDVVIDDVAPTLTSIVGDQTNGIDLEFDLDVNIGAPTITQPVDAGWEFSNAVTQVDLSTIRIGVNDVLSGGVALSRLLPATRRITLEFTDSLVVAPHGLDPANWIITTTAPGAVAVSVTGVVVVGNLIHLTTTEATNSKSYTLQIPGTDIQGSTGDLYGGPTSFAFTGSGDRPAVIRTRVVDDSNIDLIFNEDVSTASATNPSNYSFEPPLQITQVRRLSGSEYRLTVVGKRASQVYDLSVSNIVDLANNSI